MSSDAPRPPAFEPLRSDQEELALLRDLVVSSPDSTAVVQDRVIQYSTNALRPRGRDRRGEVFGALTVPEDQLRVFEALDRVQSGEWPKATVRFSVPSVAPELEALMRPIAYNGRPAVAVHTRDTSSRAEMEQALRLRGDELARTVTDLSLYREMFVQARDNISVIQDGVIVLNNSILREPEMPSALGRRLEDVLSPEDYAAFVVHSENLLESDRDSAIWEFRYPSASGGEDRILEAVVRAIEYEGRPALLLNSRDITRRVRIRRELQERATELTQTVATLEMFKMMAEVTSDGLHVIQDGIYKYTNGALLQAGAPNPVGRRVAEILEPEDAARFEEVIRSVLAGEANAVRGEYRSPLLLAAGHRTFEAIVHLTEFEERPAVLSVVRDISERKALEERLRLLSTTDALTGIANRRAFEAAVDAVLIESAGDVEHGLCFIDIDRFKSINDNFGHEAGDTFLIDVARRLAELVRSTDLAARLGGDEFALLLPSTTELDARRVAEKAVAAVEAAATDFPGIGASVGVTGFTVADTRREILERADSEMYRVKSEHRARGA